VSSAPDIVDSLSEAVRALRAGDRRVLSRMLSALEDGNELSQRLMALVRAQPGHARAPVLALTGPPGVGKSTLATALAAAAIESGYAVAVLAVDPSSPITGGAVLGDRVRMSGRLNDQIFFRSFANRGVVGGLARVIPAAVELVSAAGYSLVFIETVGVGQSEIDVHTQADVTVVVLAPHMGDEIQAAKAGLLEVADVLLVNKCDLPDAGRTLQQMRASVAMRHTGEQRAIVLKVAAATGENIAEAWESIAQLLTNSTRTEDEERERARQAALADVALEVSELVRSASGSSTLEAESILGQLLDGRLDHVQAVARIEQLLTRDPEGR